ncbi:MAG: histone [Halobacteria archaeon]|nr:histone [Halobacteria archaeon]
MTRTVELPFAPVDSLIRDADPDIRVSAGASERLAEVIQRKGAEVAAEAAEKATEDGRKTVMADDFGFETHPAEVSKDEVGLPIAPVDRIARLDIQNYRISKEARLVLADYLEDWAKDIAASAADLARHAERRTVQSEDIDAYLEICGDGSCS